MKIRKAARTVVFDREKRVAVLEVKGGMYHKIPGGGIDEGETEEEAATREALEEAGCDVKLLQKLGELEFVSPELDNLTHHSVCFLARKLKDHKTQYFTEHEKKNNFKLLWLEPKEAFKLFENPIAKRQWELNMNNRDYKFLKKAVKYVENI